MIQCNVGKADRVIRVIAALAILGVGVYLRTWWGLLGLILLVTAAIGWCPLYRLIGVSTCKEPDGEILKDTEVHDTEKPLRINE
jgi:hypothetical protein